MCVCVCMLRMLFLNYIVIECCIAWWVCLSWLMADHQHWDYVYFISSRLLQTTVKIGPRLWNRSHPLPPIQVHVLMQSVSKLRIGSWERWAVANVKQCCSNRVVHKNSSFVRARIGWAGFCIRCSLYLHHLHIYSVFLSNFTLLILCS